MTNPDTDPLDEVEAFLKGIGGRWVLIVSSLNESIRKPQPDDKKYWPGDLLEALQAERERSYERTIRAFAKEYMRIEGAARG
jgi:hypothetical protein